MRTSILNAENRKKYRWIYKILASAAWVLLWQMTSMWLKQEILLASPVSVIKRLVELIVTADFWQSIAFSFARIILGFTLALLLGTALAALAYAFFSVEILMEPLITVIKSTPVASFIILCLIWIPSRNLSVFISFLMVFPVVYTNLLEGLKQTDKQLLEMADSFGSGRKTEPEYAKFRTISGPKRKSRPPRYSGRPALTSISPAGLAYHEVYTVLGHQSLSMNTVRTWPRNSSYLPVPAWASPYAPSS